MNLRVSKLLVVHSLTDRGFESEAFTFQEIFRGKGLEGDTVSEGTVDTSLLPQWDYFNLQFYP